MVLMIAIDIFNVGGIYGTEKSDHIYTRSRAWKLHESGRAAWLLAIYNIVSDKTTVPEELVSDGDGNMDFKKIILNTCFVFIFFLIKVSVRCPI